MTRLILASASIGREYLLKGLKIPYRIMPSNIDEDKILLKNLVETIKMRAKLTYRIYQIYRQLCPYRFSTKFHYENRGFYF